MTRRDPPSIPDAYRVHPVERPSEADTLGHLALVVLIAALLIGGLVAWAVA